MVVCDHCTIDHNSLIYSTCSFRSYLEVEQNLICFRRLEKLHPGPPVHPTVATIEPHISHAPPENSLLPAELEVEMHGRYFPVYSQIQYSCTRVRPESWQRGLVGTDKPSLPGHGSVIYGKALWKETRFRAVNGLAGERPPAGIIQIHLSSWVPLRLDSVLLEMKVRGRIQFLSFWPGLRSKP